MKLIFKQRFFSWFDSYDIYDEAGNTVFTVKGKFAFGKTLKIYDALGQEIGTIKQRLFSFLPRFDLYQGDTCFGCITKEFSFFKPKFHIDCNGWNVQGSFWEWDYQITDAMGADVATITKEYFNFTDTYVINVAYTENALPALMLAIAIDCEKAQRD